MSRRSKVPLIVLAIVLLALPLPCGAAYNYWPKPPLVLVSYQLMGAGTPYEPAPGDHATVMLVLSRVAPLKVWGRDPVFDVTVYCEEAYPTLISVEITGGVEGSLEAYPVDPYAKSYRVDVPVVIKAGVGEAKAKAVVRVLRVYCPARERVLELEGVSDVKTEATLVFTITGRPRVDLVLGEPVVKESKVLVNVTLANRGTATARDTLLRVEQPYTYTVRLGDLEPGSKRVVRLELPLSSQVRVGVSVSYAGPLNARYEDGVSRTYTFTPRLEAWVEPSHVRLGEDEWASFRVVARNTASVPVEVTATATPVNIYLVPVNVSKSVTLAPGERVVLVYRAKLSSSTVRGELDVALSYGLPGSTLCDRVELRAFLEPREEAKPSVVVSVEPTLLTLEENQCSRTLVSVSSDKTLDRIGVAVSSSPPLATRIIGGTVAYNTTRLEAYVEVCYSGGSPGYHQLTVRVDYEWKRQPNSIPVNLVVYTRDYKHARMLVASEPLMYGGNLLLSVSNAGEATAYNVALKLLSWSNQATPKVRSIRVAERVEPGETIGVEVPLSWPSEPLGGDYVVRGVVEYYEESSGGLEKRIVEFTVQSPITLPRESRVAIEGGSIDLLRGVLVLYLRVYEAPVTSLDIRVAGSGFPEVVFTASRLEPGRYELHANLSWADTSLLTTTSVVADVTYSYVDNLGRSVNGVSKVVLEVEAAPTTSIATVEAPVEVRLSKGSCTRIPVKVCQSLGVALRGLALGYVAPSLLPSSGRKPLPLLEPDSCTTVMVDVCAPQSPVNTTILFTVEGSGVALASASTRVTMEKTREARRPFAMVSCSPRILATGWQDVTVEVKLDKDYELVRVYASSPYGSASREAANTSSLAVPLRLYIPHTGRADVHVDVRVDVYDGEEWYSIARSCSLVAYGKPELEVVSKALSPEKPGAGEVFAVSAVIANRGTAPAYYAVAHLRLPPGFKAVGPSTSYLGTLDPGSTAAASFTVQAPLKAWEKPANITLVVEFIRPDRSRGSMTITITVPVPGAKAAAPTTVETSTPSTPVETEATTVSSAGGLELPGLGGVLPLVVVAVVAVVVGVAVFRVLKSAA